MSLSYYQIHKEEQKQKARERRANNLEEYKRRQKEYRLKNKEEVRQRSKDYYYNNKEQANKTAKRWRQNNKEYKAQKDKEWRKNNKEHKAELDKESYLKRKQKHIDERMIPFNNLAKQYEHVPVPDYQGYYEAFENGMLWSWKKLQFKKPSLNNKKRDYVNLCKEKQSKEYLLYRVIASAFYNLSLSKLEDQQCHHCNIVDTDQSASNLVFIPANIHQLMHNSLDQQIIKSIGQQVKHLRGSAKTKQFVKLIKKELQNFINTLED